MSKSHRSKRPLKQNGRKGNSKSLVGYIKMGSTLVSVEAHKFAQSHDFNAVMWEKAKCRAQESRNWKNHQLCIELKHVVVTLI